MQAYLKFVFFNDRTGSWQALNNSVEVQVCHSVNKDVNFDILARSRQGGAEGIFAFPEINLDRDADVFFRVGFLKRNLDLRDSRLYAPADNHPIPPEFARYPAPLPYWSSIERKAIRGEAGFFHGIRNQSLGSKSAPLIFPIYVRRLYLFGHRGAPYEFPENSVDAFHRALEMGLNAVEMDICLTRDEVPIVLHDPNPADTVARNLLENLPFPMESPRIEFENNQFRWQFIEDHASGKFSTWRSMDSSDGLQVDKLTADEVRQYFLYRHPQRNFIPPERLEAVLEKIREARPQGLQVFLDIKSADEESTTAGQKMARRLYTVLEKLADSTWQFILGCPQPVVIREIAAYFEKKGSLPGVDFTIDSEGSLKKALMLGLDKVSGERASPLQVNRDAGFGVVSIGKLARPGSRQEIREAVAYRTANPRENPQQVIYWTIDDRQEIYELICEGVDGILTNRPENATEVLKRLELQLPV